ncbi:hemagglutinin repeat-containing protein [Rodentibacter myodis]|uniref:Filamentous haemagglutinin FhaB/tRNA nuclease CdiA-like TPS domain-containing protein n=1 Tax=Rodentibacter myodis TaxID=1907939 RepID=A0A1V3JPM8_9PAST|nr:hemagglutinin repeat-containing protein [Rodentibacter myodis]OOF58744.1 hypothetical protein BKL49_06235 [Rodentibacter myodis]
MSKFSLSKITLALSLCYVAQSYAEIQSANTNTQVSQQKGVEIINIATPSQSGLSHNQYNKFNVDKAGAVLNNARQDSQSQLAGQVAANPNLRQQSATVILNEVVSRNPSHIAGKQEIVGQRADYILANPNGISVEGGGFINTQRASLVVGKPTVEQGYLTGYQVDGDKALTAKGTVSGANTLDLIAPTVSVSGNLQAEGDVNVVMGRNKVARQNDGQLTVTVLPSQQGQVLDGKVVGSIQAGRIRIHSTDEQANVAITATKLEAKEVLVTAGNAKLDGTVKKSSKIVNTPISQNGYGGLKERSSKTETFDKTSIKADKVTVLASNHLTLSGAEIKAKEATVIGGKTHIGATKTTDRFHTAETRAKGSTKLVETDDSKLETAHRTTIQADSVTLGAIKDQLTAEGVKITTNALTLHGEKGISTKGVQEVNYYDATATFRNEPKKHKTGYSLQTAKAYNYVASELNVKDDMIVSGGNVNFAGTIAKVDGDLVVENKGRLSFSSEEVKNDHVVNDKERYWGGLAGSKTLASTRKDYVQQGADFTVKGAILVDAGNGVKVTGSRVVSGKDALVKGNKGSLTVNSVQDYHSYTEKSRTGMIFDITKERTQGYKTSYITKGSELKSKSNLQLVTDKNVNVVGSRVEAGGLLDISAKGNVNVKGGNNEVRQILHKSGIGFSTKVEKPTLTLDYEGVAKSSIETVKGLIGGTVKMTDAAEAVANNVKDNLKFKGEASATFGFFNDAQSSAEYTHTPSVVSGATTNISANRVNVAGSKIEATKGDLNVNANAVMTNAQHDSYFDSNIHTAFGITNTVTVTESAVTNKVALGITHKDTYKEGTNAQASQLSAAKDINLNARHLITHQGTEIQAGGNINENAKVVSHTPEYNTENGKQKNFDLGLTLTTSVDKNKAVNGSLVLGISGGREKHQESNAQSTTLTAGKDINVNTDKLSDVATQYTAGNNVNLNSKVHTIESAQNTKEDEKLSAGVTIGVSAGTKDFVTGTAGVNVGIHFQKDQSNSSTAHIANVAGNNVNINTGKLNSQGDISAKNDVNINANSASFTQSQNTSSHKGGGFNLNIGVGAIAIPAAGAALPSVDVSFNANSHKGNRTDAVIHRVEGGNNVGIHAKQDVSLQGTNVQAGNTASISGNTVTVQPGKSQVQELNVSVGGGVSVGANASSLGINGNVNVKHENSTTHPGVSINGQNVNIKSENGVHLTGVTSNSTNLTIDGGKGDVILDSAKNNVNKTEVDVGLALNGGLSGNKWTPESGSGKLNVDVVRNETHTTTDLTAENATISGNNAHFNGSSINATNVTNNLKGSVTSSAVTDKVNETGVHLSANGSGKFTPYPADNWAESAKKDWDNGTIAGVNADINVKVDATNTETVKQGGINPPKPQVIKNNVVKANVELTTKVKSRIENFIKQQQQLRRR